MGTEYETVTTNIIKNVSLDEDSCLENNSITNNKDSSIDKSFFIIKSITRSTVRDFMSYVSV